MERLVDNGLTPKFQRLRQVGDILSTGWTGFLMGELPPTIAVELQAIEDRGFDPETIQAHLDRLQTQGDQGLRTAAMLRGAFNDLLGQIEHPGTEPGEL
ncbi:MAG TPA: hypothetical protein VMR34_01325 [Candidatus Saccharimonadales bacterium]|nr:hypothetical protein [Candidatus Saccharimonadales bacterium]